MGDTTNLYGKSVGLTQLEYAHATLKAGSFSAAARRCAVSQPALSSGIAALEAVLGVKLFERTTTGALPSAAGRALLPIIGTILASASELFAVSRQLAEERPSLRLGVSPLVSPSLIANTFDAFRSNDRTVEIVFSEANLEQLRGDLAQDRLDLIVVPKVAAGSSGNARMTIASEELHYVCHDQTANKESVELSDLSGRTLVVVTEDCGLTEVTRTALLVAGVEMATHTARATSYQRLIEWADLGLGDALVPASKVPEGRVSSVVLNGGRLVMIEYEAIWNPSTPSSTAIASAISAMSSID